jgi:hypothetical protein
MVSDDLVTVAGCEPSVFVFDEGVTPNAIDEMEDDPVATALVSLGNSGYEYAVGYLVAGNYNVAFTCDGETFEPIDGKAAPITAGAITERDFP